MVAVGMAIGVSSLGIVRAEHVTPDKSKIYRCSSGTACVEGSSTGSSAWGVYGRSTTADGVHGVTGTPMGTPVRRGSAPGRAAKATAYTAALRTARVCMEPLRATTASKAILPGVGVLGRRKSTGQVERQRRRHDSESANATNLYEAIEAKADSSNTYIFEGFNASTNGLCTIDYNATLACTGGTLVKNVRTRHTNANGEHVLAYAAESATAMIEDVGTSRMVAGVANVQIDPAFAAVMDRKWYYVFLTPLGDTRGLYVSMKTASAFQVRENGGGRSRVEFDYRIVAHPLDAKNDRLPLAPAMRRPRDMNP